MGIPTLSATVAAQGTADVSAAAAGAEEQLLAVAAATEAAETTRMTSC